MQSSTLRNVLGRLRRLADPTGAKDLSDADLLERFRSHREEAAFTLLVQRHGPAVLAVCRRVLGDGPDAEDAFQATFLVLVRNAGAVRKQASLASFLYGVASRIARKARAQSIRRRSCERAIAPSAISTDPLDPLTGRELRAVLDEEIGRLPDKYRTPLVLCYLADKTHEQAARELGWPKSSLTARLGRARALLQQRLVLRGFTVPVGLLAVLLTEQTVNAMVPALLTLSTVRVAVQSLRGEPIAAAATAALADSFVKGTAVLKLTAALTLLGAIGLAAAVGYPQQKGEPTVQTQPAGSLREPKAEGRKPRVDQFGDPLPDGVVARMGSGRMRHGGYAHKLAFSPDGKSLISGGAGRLRIWDTATGQLRRRFDVATDWTLIFDLTAEGIAVARVALDKDIVVVQVIDPASGKVRRHMEMKVQATSGFLAFSPDGKRLAIPHNNSVLLYDTNTGREVLRIPVKGRWARDLAFAPDGQTIALTDITDTVHIHDAATGKSVRELKRDGDTVVHVYFSPDGRYLASIPGQEDMDPGEISIWDLKTGKERHRLKGPSGYVLRAAFSPDNKYVAIGCQHEELVLWDMATGKEVRRFPTAGLFGSIAFSPDGKALAASSGEGMIRLWDTATGRVLPGSADPFINIVLELCFSADGRRLLGHAAMHIAWDPTTGRELRRFPKVSERSWPSPLSPDESLFATADRETIRLWDTASAKEVRALKGHKEWVWAMIFTPNGRRLVSSGTDGTIRVWDVASGREVHKLTGGGDRTMRLVVSPDGRWLASASDSRGQRGPYEVILWDLTVGREKTRLALTQDNSAQQLAFSPDSRLLAAVGGGRRKNDPGEVKIWDVASGKGRHSFDGHKERIGSVAFSSDGRTLATGDMGGTLFLWELASGRKRHQFVGHESWIYSVAFSPDSRLLAAASAEAPVYVWDVTGTVEQSRRRLSEAALRRCWADLAGQDAAAAFQAIRRLAAIPEQTLPFLREHLKPVSAPDLKRIRQLVDLLDSDDFKTRQQAAAELEKQADAAASTLRRMEKEPTSLYVRRTLRQILDAQERAPESLQAARAVEALEWIATPEAIRLLGELANGAADARLSREAAAARHRLRR